MGVGDTLHIKIQRIQIVKLIAPWLLFLTVVKTLRNPNVRYIFFVLLCLNIIMLDKAYGVAYQLLITSAAGRDTSAKKNRKIRGYPPAPEVTLY